MDAQRLIARRMVVGLPREGLSPAWEKDFASYPPAGVLLFRRDFPSLDGLRALTARLRALAKPRRIFIAIDEEGGHVSQLDGHLVVPPNAALLARGARPGDLEHAARVTGERLRALGIDWAFAPVADVASEAFNPVIGPRAYGTTPEAVSTALAEVMSGFRSARVASCLKHFPGHGDTVLDSHLALPVCGADRTTLDARELVPFTAHLDAPAVMTAHVVYPALDRDQPATYSRAISTTLLRRTLGFQGVAITDALEMKGAAEGRTPAEAARRALEAGCDLLLFAFHDEAVRRARLELADALVDGTLDREAFDAARPRLAAFDAAHPEPTEEEMSRPLESLTPAGWIERLDAIATRGLKTRGALPTGSLAGGVSVEAPEPPHGHGPTLAGLLAIEGVRVVEPGAAAAQVIAVASRVPLADAEVERLRVAARSRPTVLCGLMADAFLDAVPEAALRISASDATVTARRAVARAITESLRAR